MITQDYINGYLACLDNLNTMLDETIADTDKLYESKVILTDEYLIMVASYESVQDYLASVKQNYKQLVAKLNKGN